MYMLITMLFPEIKISIIIYLFSFMSTHLLPMIIMLISMTMTIALLMYFSMKSLWFSMILILLILAGMLFLFIYVTSLTPNKKNCMKKWISFFLMIPLLMKMENFTCSNFSKNNILQFSLDKNTFLLIFVVIYLFVALMAIMNLINSSLAPLRTNK